MNSSQDVLNYLSHLSAIKKELGPEAVIEENEGIYLIMDKNLIPKLTLTKKLFGIWQELE